MLEQKVLTVDLGTSTVRAGLAVLKSGEIKQLTVKQTPSRGINSGTIVNATSAKETLTSAINKVKLESPATVPNEAYVVVPGSYTLGFQVESKITLPTLKTITYNDVNAVKNKAKDELLRRLGSPVKTKYEILHIIPQEFKVDNVDGIQNPIGHSGRELTIRAFVILAAKNYMKTVEDLFKEAGLRLKGGVLQVLASYYSIKGEDSYFNNNLLIHIGAGNTEVLYFREDKPVLLKHVPFGGEDIIKFIIQKLKVSRQEAERLYREYGYAYAFAVNQEETIDINYGKKVRKAPKVLIAALIHLKLKELFKDIISDLNEKDPSFIENLNRVYLTGGLTNLKEITTLTEKVFKAPAEVAKPKGTDDPTLAPIVGVVNYVRSLNNSERIEDVKEDLIKEPGGSGSIFQIIRRFILDLI
ncbi:cell division protein FtsA [Thermovibrio ammonificans]|jgi:cell division protein FtsA|uniref:Cell division protein FtsA n=1 Tax=Thermovibrio ammonificans (strain DSM 15698 / JCM 12110 / HB-1) TaxID=648996 RepID=E8T6N3_THEA1|nr:cell division protein FtsA [Thermovibrio ammonificans]ADU96817.1 cell division protein FtsA [Thermovibrio ammonificans HB-1]